MKYIGDKKFYKMLLIVAVPIILQNFITNLVNMIDNVMVGSLGTEQVSAVAIINQLIFVFNLATFGAVSGAGIFTSQFFGKNDSDGIRYTVRYKTFVSAIILIAAVLIFKLGGEFLINLYLHDGSYDCDTSIALECAKKYLRIMTVGLLPYIITQIFASTLKETGSTFVPMIAGVCALAINTILNYLLIFGVGFFPELGVSGAAIGTVMSRFAECGIVLIYIRFTLKKHPYFKNSLSTLHIPMNMIKQFTRKGIPLLANEIMWSVGMSFLTMCYSSYGLAIVAGCSISSTVTNLLNISFRSLGVATGIVVGNDLGANDFEKATDHVHKFNFFALTVSVVIAIITFFVADFVPYLYNVSPESERWAVQFIRITAIFMPFLCYENSSYFILRAGGRILVTALFDGFFVLFVCGTIAFVCKSFVPVIITYTAVEATNILKALLGFIFIKKKIWLRNLVGGKENE